MMGCGASSNTTQISPMMIDSMEPMDVNVPNADIIINNDNRNYHIKPQISISNSTTASTRNGFTLSSLFPCRFVMGHHSESSNEQFGQYYNQVSSVEVQTENDLIGFKCQYSQTDSTTMNEEEFDAMVTQLQKELPNDLMKLSSENKNDDDRDGDSDEENIDDMFARHKTWNHIIKNQKNEIIECKQYTNVAIQATKKKSTSITQTKFGSIDHCFLPFKNLLTASSSLGENICQCIIDSNSDDPKLIGLLSSSFDDDDNESSFTNQDNLPNKLNNNINNKEKRIHKKQQDNSWHSKGKHLLRQQKFQDCLNLLLEDVRNKKALNQLLSTTDVIQKRDVSLQTTNDILTDEAPEYAARAPLCFKNDLISSLSMFEEIDQKMVDAQDFHQTHEIAKYVCKYAKNDLFKVRALFTWITRNIKYNFKANEKDLISTEILEYREGVSKDYCRLFGDICRIMGIRVKKIDGFVRNNDYRPGYHFQPNKDGLNSWNAVFVLGAWRFIDLTLASGYTDVTGEFYNETNEHYFLTDPNVMIWTHFPYNELEDNYQRWQLLDKPLTLEEFNALPKVTEYFFQYNLSIRSKIQNPLQFRISTEVKIGSHEAMRYKYKFYPSDEAENGSLNYYVFCQLKDDRLVGSFMIQPPLEGRYILKVFSKPEREMHGTEQDLAATLNPTLTMLLECSKARKYIEPFPLNELPWGLTQKFYDYKLKLCNQKGPIIVTWGGRRRLVLEASETMLLSYLLYDSDSLEMDTRNIISREDNGLKTIFTINPPRVGTFKFILFGMPKPKQKGKWRLPLLATLMIDCKLIKPPQHDEDMIAVPHIMSVDDKNDSKKSKVRK